VISVVIPAFNEEKSIGKTLESLTCQKTTEKFEVILVDNNSTDNTIITAQNFESRINLIIVREKIKGRGAARAAGFKKARGEIILSTDADTIVPANWIDRMVTCLKSDKRYGAITGTCKFDDQPPLVNIFLNIFQPASMRLFKLVYGHYWLSGFNFGIYKKTYTKSGGFLQRLNAQEDIDLSFKVAKITKIKFVANLPVTASGRRFKNGIWRGTLSYISTFVGFFWQNNDQVVLDDKR